MTNKLSKAPATARIPGHAPIIQRGFLNALPRPLYGHIDSQSNMIIPRPHQHRWAQLSYAIRGHLQVVTAQARFIALPQRAVWIPAGIRHRVHESPYTVIRSLYIDGEALGLDWPDCRVLVIRPLLQELIRVFSTIPIEYQLDGPDGRLAQVLADQIAVCRQAGLVLPWPSDKRLQALCRQQHQHPDTAPGLAQYGHQIGLSEKTLTRLFQQQTGLGFRLWRQRARLVHALPLLEQGMRTTDVALACGYESLSSFIAAFREHTGETPREFSLRSQQADIEPEAY
ncbi:helix-turn-helix transcriptional regulator [Castellaniella sp.]|uniref:AraC family transcriptional regulator n=1 Tax=Castellaniella sp. TaxID=1955812 RepID=UPI002B003512|nr:helix-turn-helix transcriptional regulator [Castellaniella sp.]